MKNIILTLFTLSAIFVTSCKKDDFLSTDTSSIDKSNYKISADIGVDTKVSIDELVVTWKADDKIYLGEIENDAYVNILTFNIDSLSISEDGKSADFYGASDTDTPVVGMQYIAVTGASAIIDDQDNLIVTFDQSAKEQSDNDYSGWFMTSPIFESENADSIPGLCFENQQSIISLEILLDSDPVYEWNINAIEISAETDNIFTYQVSVDASGNITADSYSKYIYSSVPNAPTLSDTISVTVNLPIMWNDNISDPEGDFTFTLYVQNETSGIETEISTTIPARELESGRFYTKELTFEASTLIAETMKEELASVSKTAMQSIVYNVNSTGWAYQILQNLNADCFSGYMATPTLFSSGVNNTTYYMSHAWNNNIFTYNVTLNQNTDLINTYATLLGYPEISLIAKIIRAAGMARFTDIFGPVPYSELGQTSSAAYLSTEDIYANLVTALTNASDSLSLYLSEPTENSTDALEHLAEYDKVCGGDISLWIKYANTLRLRLALRGSVANPTWAQEAGEAAMAASGGVLAEGDKSIAYRDEDIANPLYIISSSWLDILAGAPIVSILEGYDDPRLEAYLLPMTENISNCNGEEENTLGEYHGIRNGVYAWSKANRMNFSVLNIASSSLESPLYWMKTSESYFLQAEAALRGWNVNSTAQSLYEQGITLSFSEANTAMPADYLSITSTAAAYIDPYDSSCNYESGEWLNDAPVAWQSSGTKEEQLHQIITQKWIALYPDGMEAWAEHRRTGYPKLFPNMENYSDGNTGGYIDSETFIRRLEYPTTQYSEDPTGVAEGVSLLGGTDSGATKIWWDTDAIVTGENGL